MKARTAVVDAGPQPAQLDAVNADAAEVARLQRELARALAHQTATAEVLQTISRSPTELRPVLEAIAQRAALLCHAQGARVWLPEGDQLRAMTGYGPGYPESVNETRPLRRSSVGGRAFLERRCVHVEDIVPLLDTEYPDSRGLQARNGYRTVLVVPMLRESEAIGLISLLRNDVRPFASSEIEMVQTFADQAVIAIHNARMFSELQARNREVSQALEQQTATSEILQAIGNSMSDAAPVFEKILDSCQHLFGASNTGVFLVEGEGLLNAAAWRGAFAAIVPGNYPRPLAGSMSAVAIREGALCHWPSIASAPDVPDYIQAVARQHGDFSVAVAPLMRDGQGIGTLDVMRKPPQPFGAKEQALLRSFADQALIAIENVRLFNELRVKGEQLELASRHKSQFLANMSHELRTPLNAIIGFTRIVMRRTKDQIEQKQAENLEKILASGQQLLALINAVLDLSKIEAGRVEVAASEVDLAPVLRQCVLTIEPLVNADAVSLVADIDGTLPPMWVDEEKLRQIVINLLSNAAKFTASGCIRLDAQVEGGSVHIAVADTGIGIAADKLGLIFEEFEQVDASSTRLHGGTGLGLAIARRLARLMGGEIEAASVPGRGSTFTLTLPLRAHGDAA